MPRSRLTLPPMDASASSSSPAGSHVSRIESAGPMASADTSAGEVRTHRVEIANADEDVDDEDFLPAGPATANRARLPTLVFELVTSDLPFDSEFPVVDLLYEPVLGRLIFTDGFVLRTLDPKEGSTAVLYETEFKHGVSCLCPRTGDVVLYTASGWQFFRIDARTGLSTEISLTDSNGMRVIEEPYRLLLTHDGTKIILGFDDDEDLDVVRIRPSGVAGLLDMRGQGSLHWGGGASSKAFVCGCGHAVFAWFLDENEVHQIAGKSSTPGCQDGIALQARFAELRCPVVNTEYAFVRSRDPETKEWRFARIGLESQRVQSMRWAGLDHDDVVRYAVSDHELFALRAHPTSTRHAQLLCATLPVGDELFGTAIASSGMPRMPSLGKAIRKLDLTQPVQSFAFRLAGGAVLYIDRRLLIVRSAYFADMLTGSYREASTGEVDLTTDPDADVAAVSVLLRFVLSDTWNGPNYDAELAFRVRNLADRYRLPKLVMLAEERLCQLMTPANVLSFLGRAMGAQGALEDICWDMLESNKQAVAEECAAELDELIAQNPRLAKELILRFFSGGSQPARPAKRLRRG